MVGIGVYIAAKPGLEEDVTSVVRAAVPLVQRGEQADLVWARRPLSEPITGAASC
jgi:hypothetical protein